MTNKELVKSFIEEVEHYSAEQGTSEAISWQFLMQEPYILETIAHINEITQVSKVHIASTLITGIVFGVNMMKFKERHTRNQLSQN